jgi:hypothetical protein
MPDRFPSMIPDRGLLPRFFYTGKSGITQNAADVFQRRRLTGIFIHSGEMNDGKKP